jgi:mannose-1-phosphate guanylyltransferase
MEKQTDLRVVPARVGWTDLGSWRAVLDIAERDADGNAASVGSAPEPVLIDCERTLAWADSAQVAVIGGRDMVVVQYGERILVCTIDRVQDVRTVVEALRQRTKP